MSLIVNTSVTVANDFKDRSTFRWSKFRNAFQDIVAGFTAVETQYLKKTVKAVFDPSANADQRTIGAHGLSVYLPDNAVIVRSWYEVATTFTSATDAGTIAIGTPTDGAAAGIKAAVAISNGANPYDAGNIEGLQVGTAASYHVKLTAERELTATVAVEALTAGKLTLFVDYVIGA
jgi:hypothetical protein